MLLFLFLGRVAGSFCRVLNADAFRCGDCRISRRRSRASEKLRLPIHPGEFSWRSSHAATICEFLARESPRSFASGRQSQRSRALCLARYSKTNARFGMKLEAADDLEVVEDRLATRMEQEVRSARASGTTRSENNPQSFFEKFFTGFPSRFTGAQLTRACF